MMIKSLSDNLKCFTKFFEFEMNYLLLTVVFVLMSTCYKLVTF